MDIITELKKCIKNAEDCTDQSLKCMKQAVEEENYSKANEMKVCASIHAMYAHRMQMLLDGKPAFGIAPITEPFDNTDDALETAQRILNEQKGM